MKGGWVGNSIGQDIGFWWNRQKHPHPTGEERGKYERLKQQGGREDLVTQLSEKGRFRTKPILSKGRNIKTQPKGRNRYDTYSD